MSFTTLLVVAVLITYLVELDSRLRDVRGSNVDKKRKEKTVITLQFCRNYYLCPLLSGPLTTKIFSETLLPCQV